MSQQIPDSLSAWMEYYLEVSVQGVRSAAVTQKIRLHLQRFQQFFAERYGQERVSSWVKRDSLAWQHSLEAQSLAAATINNHMASLSAFGTWIVSHHPQLMSMGDPTKGIAERSLAPLEPRSLSEIQVQSLKNLCDRLLPYYRVKGRHWSKVEGEIPLRVTSRPWRDRAIVFVLLSTGLRREELVQLDLSQLSPNQASELRQVHRARINKVHGKGKSQRDVFLSQDARHALADYLEQEHPQDSLGLENPPLFLSAIEVASRRKEGRLAPRSINNILEQIGHWHDAEIADKARHISPLRPHDLRHTFAFLLAKVTGADAFELERRLGHRSQRYIQRYTNPPEAVAANYIEAF
jgi:site-specific recombinase XerD